MRFKPYIKVRAAYRGATPRRLAAARRALQREVDRMPLFADDVRKAQPTPEQRILNHDNGWAQAIKEMRKSHARKWLEGRQLLRSLPEQQRKTLLAEWNAAQYPGDPFYFLEFLHHRLEKQA